MGGLSSLILIYVGVQRLLAYSMSDFQGNAEKYSQLTKSNIKHQKHGLFIRFYKIIVSFFSFLCQDANKTISDCAIKGCSLSKKHKHCLYKTQNGEPNYVGHKFFLNFY